MPTRLLVTALAAVLLLVPAAHAQGTPPDMPMYGVGVHGLGTWFVYTSPDCAECWWINEDVEYRFRQGRWAILVYETSSHPPAEGEPCHGQEWELWDLETGAWVACMDENRVLAHNAPHDSALRFPLVAGNTWEDEYQENFRVSGETRRVTVRRTVEACGLQITVPSGTFSTCRVTGVNTDTGETSPTIWYAPDEDLVPQLDFDGFLIQLQDYRLGFTPDNDFVFGDEVPRAERELLRESTGLAMRYVWEETGAAVSDFTVFAFRDRDNFFDAYLHQRGVAEHAREEVIGQVLERLEPGDRFGTVVHLTPDDMPRAGQGIFLYDGASFGDEFELLRLMAHEYFHVIQNEDIDPAGFSGRPEDDLRLLGPIWLLEGSAEYVAQRTLAEGDVRRGRFDAYRARQLAEARGIDQPLRSLEPVAAYALGNAPYTLGFLAVDLLVDTCGGLEPLVSFYEAFPDGTTWQDAFQDHFGSIEAFYDEFEFYRREAFPPAGDDQVAAGTK